MINITPDIQKNAETLNRLQIEHQNATNTVNTLKSLLEDYELAIEEGITEIVDSNKKCVKPSIAVKLTRIELNRANNELIKKKHALDAARRKYSQSLEYLRLIENGNKWVETQKLTYKREKLAIEIEKYSKLLVDNLNELYKISYAAFSNAPWAELPFHQSPLTDGKINSQLLVNFQKLGCSWAREISWGLRDEPTFIEAIKKTNEWLLKQKDKQATNYEIQTNEIDYLEDEFSHGEIGDAS